MPIRPSTHYSRLLTSQTRRLTSSTTTRISYNPLNQTVQSKPYLIQSIISQNQYRKMSSSSNTEFQTYKIENTTLPPFAGEISSTEATPHQSLIIASVLDLFGGFATKRKLSLWTDDAVFADPITKAEGRKQYESQWYGLKTAFSDIQKLDAKVTKLEKTNIGFDLKTKYKVKGVDSEHVIDSKIVIDLDQAGEKIVKVEDRWGGDTPPDGAFAKALRNLNSVTVPTMVKVPKSIEEEESSK